jgi:glycosyltransferase involved in cell wall biosynthesis
MPVYNAANTLPYALRSLSNQSFINFEVIAVDDGSVDGSLAVLEEAASRDVRIKPVPIKRSGIVGALNSGLKLAKGEFIARMDADDVCHPKRLELQHGFMRDDPACALTGSRARVFPRSGLKDGMLHYESWLNSVVTGEDIWRDLFVESPFPHPSVMFRKADAISLGGYRCMGWPEDYDLWLRFAQAGMGMAKLPETLLFWREGETRLSRNHGMYSAENFRRLKAHFLWHWRLKEVRDLQLWGAGRDGKTWAKLLMKTGFNVVQFIDIDKKKVGGRACGGIPVVWPSDIIKGLPILCAVGIKGARDQIRDYLLADGYREPEEFFFLS